MRGLIVLSTFAVLAVASTSIAADNGHAESGGTPGVLAPIQVAVFAPPDITESLLDFMFAEVDAIWGSTGITFDWHRITSTGAGAKGQLDVTIDELGNKRVPRPAALGWIEFTAGGPGSCIHLSQRRAEALIRDTSDLADRTVLTHETFVARALGRALSHEIGHYLLQSKAHTPRGLMRAVWPSGQILSINRQGFELSAEQGEVAVRHIRQDERTRSGA